MFSRLFASKPISKPQDTLAPCRTPSPSASVSSTIVARASISPGAKQKAGIRSPSPSSSTDILELIKSVPPKTLHSFLVSRLSSPTITNEELASLTSFFLCPSTSGVEPPLAPPPRLHCARCHDDYFECENTTRSCVMAHDDESAIVEFVGRGKKGAEYETNWGCCGQTVDGDGDLGPPAGWCFEGKHCADRNLAKYRHDADEHGDRLDSCERKKCFQKKRGHKRRARPSDPSSISSLSGISDVTAAPRPCNKENQADDGEEEVQQDKRKKRRKVA